MKVNLVAWAAAADCREPIPCEGFRDEEELFFSSRRVDLPFGVDAVELSLGAE